MGAKAHQVSEQLGNLLEVVGEADRAILDVYNSGDFATELKADDTPVTRADIASHKILVNGLSRLFPDIPILSEEGDPETKLDILQADSFWLVDPLDGTREFLNRSGDFTVCAGLIENAKPTFGIVSAPARGITYYGGSNIGEASFKIGKDGYEAQVRVQKNNPGIVIASRLFLNDETKAFIEEHYADFEMVSVGSQLKLPMIAEGKADVCPRLNTPQHLWDVAAGHAILTAAGGSVTRFDGSPMDYRNETLLAGDFIAMGVRR